MLEIFKLIVPIFLLIGVGSVLKIMKIADDTWVEVLNRYGLYIGFPSLIFLNLISLVPEDLAAKAEVFIVNGLLLVLVMLAALGISILLKLPPERANAIMLAAIFGNIAYLGYPLIGRVYPGRGPETTIIISIYVLILFSLGILLLEVRRHQREPLLQIAYGILRNPFIVAIVLGVLVFGLGWKIPPAVHTALEMLSQSASPVVLVSLGVFLARKIPLHSIWKPALAVTAMRLFLVPALFYVVAWRMNSIELYQVTVLEAAMPLAVTPFALSSMYPLDRSLTVTVIFISSIASLLTLPLWVMWMAA